MATVYATLEEPGAGEVAQQTEETLTDKHDAGAAEVNGAQLLIRRRMRGLKTDFAESYGAVTQTGKKW